MEYFSSSISKGFISDEGGTTCSHRLSMTIHRDHKKVNGAALASSLVLKYAVSNIIISGFNHFESGFTDIIGLSRVLAS